MKIQDFVKQIKGVSNCVWHYDEMLLEIFIKENEWNNRNIIMGKVTNHIVPNLLRNFETIRMIQA